MKIKIFEHWDAVFLQALIQRWFDEKGLAYDDMYQMAQSQSSGRDEASLTRITFIYEDPKVDQPPS